MHHLPHASIGCDVLSRALFELLDVDAWSLYPIAKIACFADADDGVAPAIRRQVVDKIHEPVFEAADRQAIDHMAKERRGGRHSGAIVDWREGKTIEDIPIIQKALSQRRGQDHDDPAQLLAV